MKKRESNTVKTAYLFEAIKIKMWHSANLGIAFQSPITADREFDAKTLLQIETNI